MSQFLALSHLQAMETPINKTTCISLNTEAMPLALWILSPASHGLGWFQIFLKRTSQLSQFLFFGAHDISPVQIGCHILLLLRRWKRPFAGGPACCATASCVQTILSMVEKLGTTLHPMDTMALASLSSLEGSASLSSSTSLFPLILWHEFRLWTVRQTVHSGVLVITVHRRMFCPRKVQNGTEIGAEISHSRL